MRILVVEDEDKVASFIKKGLEQSSYTVDTVPTGEDALAFAIANAYDAIVLDIMLPGRDGLSVVRELRSRSISTPVLALTARGTLEDKIQGLDSGCDDYLPKPFAFDELLARLRALLRRQPASRAVKLEYSGIVLDPVTRAVTRDGKPIELTNKEYALLELLLRHPGQVFTRTAILESVWGYDFDAGSNVLEVYMNFLRKRSTRQGGRNCSIRCAVWAMFCAKTRNKPRQDPSATFATKSRNSPIHNSKIFDVLEMVVMRDNRCANGERGCRNPDVVEWNQGFGTAQVRSYLTVNCANILRRLNDAVKIVERFVTRSTDFVSQLRVQCIVIAVFPLANCDETDMDFISWRKGLDMHQGFPSRLRQEMSRSRCQAGISRTKVSSLASRSIFLISSPSSWVK